MRVERLTVHPFSFTDILDIKIHKSINKHGSAWIKGVIPDEMEDEYVRNCLGETPVTLMAYDFDDNRQVLFQGILENMNISFENGLKVMELFIMPYSRLLDLVPNTMVFQNINLTYNNLVDAVVSPFGADAIVNAGDGQPIGQMYVQYHETAWTFLVRMASTKGDVVVPYDVYSQTGIKLYFGFHKKPDSNAPPPNPISFEVKRNLGGYLFKRENNVLNVTEGDSVYYIIKEREIRELGEPVFFQRRQVYVVSIDSTMEGGEPVHSYVLASRMGINVPQSHNYDIIGASLSGTVSAVSGAHIKINMDTAHSNDTSEVKWHPFSTVYSSPDGTGWYAMPELGDMLRLYFPTEIDNDAYTISAVHLDPAARQGQTATRRGTSQAGASAAQSSDAIEAIESIAEEPRTDPDYKVLSNSYGKTIVLAPDAIYMTGGGGSVMIEDGVGVTIVTDYDVAIDGKQNVSITSLEGEVSVIGKTNVTITQENATVELGEEKVAFRGAEVRTR